MYKLYRPPEHLKNIVKYYWLLDLSSETKSRTEYIFAYPYVNCVFTLGIPYTVKDGVHKPLIIKDTWILGPRTHSAEYFHPGGNLTFGARFQVGSTVAVFKEQTKLLTNKIILQDDISPASNWLHLFSAKFNWIVL